MVASLRHCGNSPSLIALRGETVETFNFSAVADEVEQLAPGLLEASLDRGEPVGIFAEDRLDWIIAFLAIAAAGTVAVPLDVSLRGPALAGPVRAFGCRRLFVSRRDAAYLQDCDAVDNTELYLLGGGTSGATPELIGWRNVAAAENWFDVSWCT